MRVTARLIYLTQTINALKINRFTAIAFRALHIYYIYILIYYILYTRTSVEILKSNNYKILYMNVKVKMNA